MGEGGKDRGQKSRRGERKNGRIRERVREGGKKKWKENRLGDERRYNEDWKDSVRRRNGKRREKGTDRERKN